MDFKSILDKKLLENIENNEKLQLFIKNNEKHLKKYKNLKIFLNEKTKEYYLKFCLDDAEAFIDSFKKLSVSKEIININCTKYNFEEEAPYIIEKLTLNKIKKAYFKWRSFTDISGLSEEEMFYLFKPFLEKEKIKNISIISVSDINYLEQGYLDELKAIELKNSKNLSIEKREKETKKALKEIEYKTVEDFYKRTYDLTELKPVLDNKLIKSKI